MILVSSGSPRASDVSIFESSNMSAEDGAGVMVMRGAVVRAVLDETRNGTNLVPMLKDATETYLTPMVSGDNAEVIKAGLPSGTAAWIDTFEEAWAAVVEKIMPKYVKVNGDVWAGVILVDIPPVQAQAPETQAPVAGLDAAGLAAGNQANVLPVGDNEILFGMNVSPMDRGKALADCRAQNIIGNRIIGLSVGVVSGRVHPLGDTAEARYGADPRLCPLIRSQRKAGVQTLDDVLATKSKRELSSHFSLLAKDYNSRQMIEEATLVSQFWSEATSAYEGDDEGLMYYIKEYMRVYCGRGIPKLLDTDIIVRTRKTGGGGASSTEVEKIRRSVESLSAKLVASEARAADLGKRLTRAESKTSGINPGGGLGAKECYICGGPHLARNCPEKPRNKNKAKGDDSDEGKAEGE